MPAWIQQKLGSRKLLAAVGAALAVVGAMLQGSVTPGDAINSLVSIVIAYLAAEGAVDVARVVKGGSSK